MVILVVVKLSCCRPLSVESDTIDALSFAVTFETTDETIDTSILSLNIAIVGIGPSLSSKSPQWR